MKSLYVQVPTTEGIFFIDMVFLALLDMGYQRNVDYSPENPLNLSEKEQKVLEDKVTNKHFHRQTIKKLKKMTFDQIFEEEVEAQFIPFIPERQTLKDAFDDGQSGEMTVVTQLDEVPYLKIDGFDADIAAEEEAQRKRKLASKIAQSVVAAQSPLASK